MKNNIMSRIYCYHDSFIPDDNDIIMYNGVVYQVLTRRKNGVPFRFSKSNFKLLSSKGVLKTSTEFERKVRKTYMFVSKNLSFYYFDMERFRELTGTPQPINK